MINWQLVLIQKKKNLATNAHFINLLFELQTIDLQHYDYDATTDLQHCVLLFCFFNESFLLLPDLGVAVSFFDGWYSYCLAAIWVVLFFFSCHRIWQQLYSGFMTHFYIVVILVKGWKHQCVKLLSLDTILLMCLFYCSIQMFLYCFSPPCPSCSGEY